MASKAPILPPEKESVRRSWRKMAPEGPWGPSGALFGEHRTQGRRKRRSILSLSGVSVYCIKTKCGYIEDKIDQEFLFTPHDKYWAGFFRYYRYNYLKYITVNSWSYVWFLCPNFHNFYFKLLFFVIFEYTHPLNSYILLIQLLDKSNDSKLRNATGEPEEEEKRFGTYIYIL